MTQDPSASRRGQGASTSGSTERAGESSPGTAKDLASRAKAAAGQAQGQASNIAGKAGEQVNSQLASQKDRVAEGLGGFAQSLRQTGQQMRDQDQIGLTGYVDRAASQVESFSDYLRQHDMGQLVDDVERFARREPALFIGGAFVLGLLGARFMKSSRPRPRYDERYYSSSAYESPYRPYYTGYAGEMDYGSSGEREISGRGAGAGSQQAPRTSANPREQGSRQGGEMYNRDREGS